MTFVKPKGVSYTDMAIYIDENVYKDDCDDNLVYQYLYHIINMLAYNGKFFKTARQYDDFSIQSATYIFMRLKNKKQYEWDYTKESFKLEKIKSVLNYIKRLMYPMRVMFEQNDYSQQYQDKEFEIEDNYSQISLVRQHAATFNKIELYNYIESLSSIFIQELENIPYKDAATKKYIHISCLLTFLNMVTLDNESKSKIFYKSEKLFQNEYIISKFFINNKQDCIILYNLPKDMENYIFVLVNKIRHTIADEISEMLQSWEVSDNMAKNILMESVYESDLVDTL